MRRFRRSSVLVLVLAATLAAGCSSSSSTVASGQGDTAVTATVSASSSPAAAIRTIPISGIKTTRMENVTAGFGADFPVVPGVTKIRTLDPCADSEEMYDYFRPGTCALFARHGITLYSTLYQSGDAQSGSARYCAIDPQTRYTQIPEQCQNGSEAYAINAIQVPESAQQPLYDAELAFDCNQYPASQVKVGNRLWRECDGGPKGFTLYYLLIRHGWLFAIPAEMPYGQSPQFMKEFLASVQFRNYPFITTGSPACRHRCMRA